MKKLKVSRPARDDLIFYRLIEDCVEIVRVVHGARDLKALFE